ncbi:MAG: hypothetical protein Q9214_003541 [Letrouitia sp. 1 TL-2023]
MGGLIDWLKPGLWKKSEGEHDPVFPERANADIAQLLRRFENLIEYNPVRLHFPNSPSLFGHPFGSIDVITFFCTDTFLPLFDPTQTDRNAAAVNAYQMEVETAALIRAAEDILSLTRVMKECWLFGKLQTVGSTSETEERAEREARAVAEKLGSAQLNLSSST